MTCTILQFSTLWTKDSHIIQMKTIQRSASDASGCPLTYRYYANNQLIVLESYSPAVFSG